VTSLEYDGDNLQSVVYAEPAWSLYPGATEVPGA